MGSIALQAEATAGTQVAVAANVIFNEAIFCSGDIDINTDTGELLISQPGRYIINWWVATQTSTSANGIAFNLVTSQGDVVVSNSAVKNNEISGFGIVDIAAVPATASLVNGSSATVFYSPQVSRKAMLMVWIDNEAGPTGPTGEIGPTGPTGATGDAGATGATGAMAGTSTCFAVAQLSNLLAQMITAYSSTTWTVYTNSLATFSGMPLDLYTGAGATGPGLLRLVDINGDFEAIPIMDIVAIYPGDGTVYDPSFTYLVPPDPLAPGCDTDRLCAILSYLPLNTAVELRLGPAVSASGDVYRNEYGVLILSDAGGNTPIVVNTMQILRIFTTAAPLAPRGDGSAGNPRVGLIQT